MADELSREEVTERLETIFSAALEGDELEKLISSIPKRLEKFDGRWDGLIMWAEKKYGSQDSTASEDSDEPEDAEEPEEKPAKKGGGLFSKLGRSKKAEAEPEEEAEAAAISEIDTVLQAIEGGDSEAALSSLKELATDNGSDPEVWRAMAAYFSSIGHVGRSKACDEQAESLS